jgi:hypothetical protein
VSEQRQVERYSNWSGSLRFTPDGIARPEDEAELRDLVVRRAEEGRHVRVNDLSDPYAPPLGREYVAVVEADAPVVAQFGALDSREAENASLATVAYGEE